jgi:hypothetical protein
MRVLVAYDVPSTGVVVEVIAVVEAITIKLDASCSPGIVYEMRAEDPFAIATDGVGARVDEVMTRLPVPS